MDDAWGDPWAAPVTIELAPAARPATGLWEEAPGGDGALGTPLGLGAASPWDEGDDAWAGAGAGEDEQPWADSPARRQSPDPWAQAAERDGAAHGSALPYPLADAVAFDASNAWAAHDAADDKRAPRPADEQPSQSLRSPDAWPARETAVRADDTKTPKPVDEQSTPSRASPSAPPRPAAGIGNMPAIGRQTSRVQGLVDLFDGIARGNASSPDAATTGIKAVLRHRPSPEAAGSPEDELRTTSMNCAVESCPDGSMGVSPQAERHSGGRLGTMASSGDWKGAHDIEYAVDLPRLDDLFPTTPMQPSGMELRPASVNDHAFTTVSERRVWYRISRFGSMRRHDQGDSEDYVRVGWVASGVRARTLELVRRWMQPDSSGAHVVRGGRGGLGGGSMFHWDDAAAPPVGIGELLRQASASGERGSLPAAAPWPTSSEAELSASPAVRLAMPLEASLATPAPGSNAAAQQAADDDDWGEMVTWTSEEPKSSLAALSGADAAVVGLLPSSGGMSHDRLGLTDSGHEDAVPSMKDLGAAPSGDDSGPGWAWGLDAAFEVAMPTPPRAAREAEPLARHEARRRPDAGADLTSLLLSVSGTSTDDMMAAADGASERGPCADDELVARVLGGLPDLSYMLRSGSD